MKLSLRLAVVFASTTILLIVATLVVTGTAFLHAQERQLDHALLARAHHRAQVVARLGAHLLEQALSEDAPGSDLDELVQYSAVYHSDGRLVSATGNLGSPPPTLEQLGWDRDRTLPEHGLEFAVRGSVLRGVLVPVHGDPRDGTLLLLLAASRSDIDADTAHLVRMMGGVLVGSTVVTLILGWLLGRYLSTSMEYIAAVARKVSEGDQHARVQDIERLRGMELRSLAKDLNGMIAHMAKLVDVSRRFVSHAAHELRSPLSVLRGELELALHRPRSEAEYRQALEATREQAERLIVLAEDLLTLAKLDAQPQVRAKSRVALRGIVERVLEDLPQQAKARVRMEVTIGNEEVRGWPLDLQRVVRNLLDNALGHAPIDSVLRVRSEQMTKTVRLLVEDQGCGIDPALSERIFEPFFRGATSHLSAGNGLGLSIAREIAHKHGGELAVDPSYGTGARFVLTLPC